MIMMFEGGMRKPSVPARARLPMASSLPYRRLRSSASAMRPTTCVVAADEPEIAAKIEQPTTLTCSSRPGSRPVQGARPWNSERESFVRNRISPMTMNSGSARSSCVVRMFQAYCGKSLSRGMLRNSPSSSVPVIASVSPIQMPPASAANSTPNIERTIVATPLLDRRGAHGVILERQAENGADRARHELEGEENHAEGDDRLRQPDRRVARIRGLAAAERGPGELHHRPGEKRGERRSGHRSADLEETPRSGRKMREHQRDPDMAAGRQRHRGAEGEGRTHEIRAVLPGGRDIGRKPRDHV